MKTMIVAALAGSIGLAAGSALTALAQPPAGNTLRTTQAGPETSPRAAQAPRPPAAPTPATGAIGQIPADLKPSRLRSSAIYVNDLPAQLKWYETVFGFSVARQISATEIVESLDPTNPDAVNLVLEKQPRQPGATSYGRLILNVPNVKDLVAFLQTHGVATTTVAANTVYYVYDPEGNQIELYQPTPTGGGRGGGRGAAPATPATKG